MDKAEIQARISQIQWFHNYEIIPGVRTNGLKQFTEEELGMLCRIPQDLHGKRVLDIGCAEGYYTFLAESRGASVVAIDAWPHQGFSLAHELRESQAEFHQLDVYDLQPDTFGTFDLVFFMGVYYHLKNPILALERIASVTRELAIIESQISNLELFEAEAVSRFYETDELANDPTNWWAPNLPCLVQTVRAAGFPRVEIIGTYNNHSRAILHAYKGPRTAAKMLTEDIIGFIHTPSANTEVSGAVQVSGIAFSKLEPERGVERVTVYLDKLDDPAAELGEAKYGLWRNDITARVGSRYGNVGFEFTWDTAGITPGPHILYVLVEGQYGWQNIRQPIMVKGTRKFFSPIHQKEIPAGSAKTPTQRNGNQEILTLSPQSSGLIEEAHYFGDLSTSMQLKFAELYRLAENIRVFLSTQSSWPLASGMRRAFHNLVIYYVNTLANKQKRFNQDIATTLKQIAVSQHHMGSDIEAMEAEIAALRAEIQALQAKSE